MKVYLDIIFIVNLIFDFIILLSVSIVLKRNVKLYRIIIGSIFGSLSLIILFIRFNKIELILYKLIVSSLMILISFGHRNIKYTFKNFTYFYIIGIILGGIIYFFNNQFSINEGLLFINNNNYNIIIGIIISIFGIKIYLKNIRELRNNYNKYYRVKIYYKNKVIDLNAFLDTGNKLKDPYSFKPIILVNKDIILEEGNILVPYSSCNYSGILKCIKADRIFIDGLGYRKNFLIGISDSISLDGIDCILNELLLEG